MANPPKEKKRVVELTLSYGEDKRWEYLIRVDGRTACDGASRVGGRAIDSYNSALKQLEYNADTFALDCPNPFMSEGQKCRWVDSAIERGDRDEPKKASDTPQVEYEKGHPVFTGVYACRVPLTPNDEAGGQAPIKLHSDVFLMYRHGVWTYCGSDQKYRGEVTGWIGPLRRKMETEV